MLKLLSRLEKKLSPDEESWTFVYGGLAHAQPKKGEIFDACQRARETA
ncbi:MAG: hypothetical protein ACUVTB_05165 [Candidatus Bathycorpusculaceae bacterium]